MAYTPWHARFNALTETLRGKPVDEIKAAWAAFFARERIAVGGDWEDEAAAFVSAGFMHSFT
jgi:hypothetical protein